MITFTSKFSTEKNKSANAPVSVLKMEWPVVNGNPSITLYLTDQTMTIGAINSIACVLNWAEIDYLLTQGESAGRSIADSQVELSNAPFDFGAGVERFSDFMGRYPVEAATATLYQWFGGATLDESDLSPLLVAECEPLEWNERSIVIDLTLISALYGDEIICRKITTNEYPNAPESSIGQRMPIPIGTVPGVKAIPVRKANRTEVSSIAKDGDTTLDVRDTAKFPAAGSLLLGDDTITYTGKTATQFTGCNGINSVHFADEEVIENISDFRCLCFDKNYPIQAITKVKVGDDTDTTAAIDLVNGEVVFPKTPRKRIGTDTRFQFIRFDNVEAGTTALNPHNALTLDDKGVYAQINQTAKYLKMTQTDIMPPIGDLGKVNLRVEHFAEEKYPADVVSVKVNGLNVGNLSKPGADDQADVVGTADDIAPVIDTLSFPIDIPTPAISPTTQADHVIEQGALTGVGRGINITNGHFVTFPAAPAGAIKTEYQINLTVDSVLFGIGPAVVNFDGTKVCEHNVSRNNFDFFPSFTRTGSSPPSNMQLAVGPLGGQWTVSLFSVKRLIFYPPSPTATQQTQQTSKSGGISDVTVSAPLTVTTEKSTNGIVDLFDITSLIADNWGNLTNMTVEFEYNGVADGRTVYLIGAEVAAEFHTGRYQATDQVYVDCNGVIDDGAGAVTGTPNAMIETVPDFLKWSVIVAKGLPASTIHTASFASAATKFANAISGGYKMAGVIQGEMTFDDLWEQLEFEARCQFFFDHEGKARLIFRPENDSGEVDGQEVITVTQSMVKVLEGGVDHITFKRTPKTEIANTIDMKYARDYFKQAWSADVSLSDAVSVQLYGKKEKHPTKEWELHFCRIPEQAENVGEFWLSQLIGPNTIVETGLTLKQMELERGDIVKFDHPLGSLSGILAEVLPGQHIVGSGRDQVQDHILLSLRLFPVAFLRDLFSDNVEATDTISLLMSFVLNLTDNLEVVENVLTQMTTTFADNVEAQELIATLMTVVNTDNAEIDDLMNVLHFTGFTDFIDIGEAVLLGDETGYGDDGYGDSYGGMEQVV